MKVGIRYIDFIPGDRSSHYSALPNFQERIASLGMPDEPDLWRWGHYRHSEGDYREHIEAGCAQVRTFLASRATAIDHVVFCAPCINDCSTYVETVRSLDFPAAHCRSFEIVKDTDCVNLLAAVERARQRLADGAREVLVLASEKLAKETWRFKKFSLFSDYSMSMVISAEMTDCPYEVIDVLIRPDPEPGPDTGSVLGRKLERSCLNELLGRNRMSAADVGQFCYINLYEPMYQMKGKDLGFDIARMPTARIAEFGHCYGADPFAAMVSYFAPGDSPQKLKPALLCASSKQCNGMALVGSPPGRGA